jgi:hypothetical protein
VPGDRAGKLLLLAFVRIVESVLRNPKTGRYLDKDYIEVMFMVTYKWLFPINQQG